MTRAEEAALKAYPQNGDNIISREGYRLMRSIYADGYEQAVEDITRQCMNGKTAKEKYRNVLEFIYECKGWDKSKIKIQ